jgi:hypothetical protein
MAGGSALRKNSIIKFQEDEDEEAAAQVHGWWLST